VRGNTKKEETSGSTGKKSDEPSEYIRLRETTIRGVRVQVSDDLSDTVEKWKKQGLIIVTSKP
jgi:hypothetical protein